MPDEGCRIAIVDIYPLFREGVLQALRRNSNFTVVGEGTTAEEAERLVSDKKPDVLLLEAAVPDSLKVAQAILRAHADVKIAFLASIEDQEHIAQALHGGAHGYIMKGISGKELIRAIQLVHGGERYITADLAWLLVARAPASPARRGNRRGLSIREQQVLDCASKGLTNAEIARMMGLALGTIKYYKTLAFRKMGVRNRMEALTLTKTTRQS